MPTTGNTWSLGITYQCVTQRKPTFVDSVHLPRPFKKKKKNHPKWYPKTAHSPIHLSQTENRSRMVRETGFDESAFVTGPGRTRANFCTQVPAGRQRVRSHTWLWSRENYACVCSGWLTQQGECLGSIIWQMYTHHVLVTCASLGKLRKNDNSTYLT